MVSSIHKPPLHPDEMDNELDVEAYRLPRWDADGNLIDDRPKPVQTVTEDVEEDVVKPPTAEEIQQIHDSAYDEGFESGYQQGMRQGQQDGHKAGHQQGYDEGSQVGREAGEQAGFEAALKTEEKRIRESLAPLEDVLKQLQQVLPAQEAALREGLVALAVRLARNLFDAELALKPEHIQTLVHNAVQALPNADERLVIELHPDDLALVERIADSHWQLQTSDDLSRGGCRVRSRFSYVDYSLEHRFRQQLSNLLAQAGLSERLTELEQPWPLPEAGAAPQVDIEQGDDEVLVESPGRPDAAAPAEPASDPEAEREQAAEPQPEQDSAESESDAGVDTGSEADVAPGDDAAPQPAEPPTENPDDEPR